MLVTNYYDFGRHKIVIVEGNYLLLEEDAWRDIRALFDEKW
jgi:pantothenate kinase